MTVNGVRIFADEDGESHFEDISVELAETDFAPPAPSLLISGKLEARNVFFGVVPKGWVGDWHPTPARQYFALLDGTLECEVSAGEMRRIDSGGFILLEDTSGKGHVTRVLGDTDARGMFVQLPD